MSNLYYLKIWAEPRPVYKIGVTEQDMDQLERRFNSSDMDLIQILHDEWYATREEALQREAEILSRHAGRGDPALGAGRDA